MGDVKLQSTALSGLMLIEGHPAEDERGRFERIFCDKQLKSLRPGLHFPQINLSTTFARGTVRGLHLQVPPAAEAKLIRCLRGSVFDVAVDLRAGSPTFLQWHAVELSERNSMQVFIPEGFAHGFQSLSDDAQLLYLHTAAWSRDCEKAFRYDDPMLSITWPLPVAMVSRKDQSGSMIDESFAGVQL